MPSLFKNSQIHRRGRGRPGKNASPGKSEKKRREGRARFKGIGKNVADHGRKKVAPGRGERDAYSINQEREREKEKGGCYLHDRGQKEKKKRADGAALNRQDSTSKRGIAREQGKGKGKGKREKSDHALVASR